MGLRLETIWKRADTRKVSNMKALEFNRNYRLCVRMIWTLVITSAYKHLANYLANYVNYFILFYFRIISRGVEAFLLALALSKSKREYFWECICGAYDRTCKVSALNFIIFLDHLLDFFNFYFLPY